MFFIDRKTSVMANFSVSSWIELPGDLPEVLYTLRNTEKASLPQAKRPFVWFFQGDLETKVLGIVFGDVDHPIDGQDVAFKGDFTQAGDLHPISDFAAIQDIFRQPVHSKSGVPRIPKDAVIQGTVLEVWGGMAGKHRSHHADFIDQSLLLQCLRRAWRA